MVSRNIRSSIVISLAAFAIAAIPGTALAGNPTTDSLSSVDAISTDVSVNGVADSSSKSTFSEASDSPTTSTYGGNTEIVPPPVDCSTPGTSTDSGSGTGSTTSKPTDDCKPSVVECSAADTDGLDANGKPCVAEIPTEPVTEGGGEVVEDATELPIEAPEVVSGGGEAPAPAPTPVVAGGGGPELPFTGLPLSTAIWGGLGLMLLGGAVWFRGRGHQAG